MATWTAADLADAVLKHLGIVSAGQSAAAEDTAIVTSAYTSLHPQLRRHSLAPWGSGAIEEEYQEPLTKYVAGEVAIKFGFSGGRLAEFKAEGREGWRQMQEQASADRTNVPVRARYF